jgi:3-oxoacyl-[acyl-carrier-protein] synthase II
MTGHLLGASSAVEAIALVKSLQQGIIPPTINQEQSDPVCNLDYVPNEAREANLNIGLSNSFGFGGHNAVIVLKNYNR